MCRRGPLWVALCCGSLLGGWSCGGATGQAREPKPPVEAEPEEDFYFEEEELPTQLEPAKPLPLPEGTVVLHVGSSTAGAMGPALKQELEARGIKCVLKFKESTYIPQWAGAKMGLKRYLARYEPDLVIVSLGGNEVEIADPTRRIEPIKRLVQAIGDRPCVWVGTPRWKVLNHTGLLEVIRDHSSPCRFIDSDELAPNMQPLKDGIHPTVPERRRWAQRIVQWLEHNRDPNGERAWSLKQITEIPPEEVAPESDSAAPEPQREPDVGSAARVSVGY